MTAWGRMLSIAFTITNFAFAEVTPTLLNEVSAAWAKREASTTTFDCEFDTEYFHAAKSTSLPGPRGEAVFLPVKDTIVLQKERLRISGNTFGRYDCVGPQLIESTQTFEERPFVAIFDGKSETFFDDGDKTNVKLRFYPSARIRPVLHFPEIDVLNNLMPLYAAFRPTAWLAARRLALDKAHSLQETDETGNRCIFLRFNDGDAYFDMYLDRQRDFIPVRFQTKPRDKVRMLTIRCDMQFADDDTLGLVPQSWKTTIFNPDGGIRWEYRSRVKRFNTNSAIADEVFHYDFPAGTVIENSITGEFYVLKEDGRKRPIGSHEDVTLEQYPRLLTTESPEPTVRNGRARIWISILVAVGLFSLIVWRRVASQTP